VLKRWRTLLKIRHDTLVGALPLIKAAIKTFLETVPSMILLRGSSIEVKKLLRKHLKSKLHRL